jgi:hypothetical protein
MDRLDDTPYNPSRISQHRIDEINEAVEGVKIEVEAVERANAEAEARKQQIETLLDTVYETTFAEEGFSRPTAAQQHDNMDAIKALQAMGISTTEYWAELFAGMPINNIVNQLMREFPRSPLEAGKDTTESDY